MVMTKYSTTKASLHWGDCREVRKLYLPGHFQLALFSTPYPKTRGETVTVSEYLNYWLPTRLIDIVQVMDSNSVIMQNIWFPRTKEGWYDERIFQIPGIYHSLGFRMIDTHPWDKINAPPSGNHNRYDHNEFEFCFTFANGPDYTYHKYRKPYAKKTTAKALSGNMRKTDIAGHHAGGHSDLHEDGAAQGNIYRFSPTGGREVYRPRIDGGVFPIGLARRAIHQYSNPGDDVLDPFCGSGTTIVEAVNQGRYAVGFDIVEDNIDMAINWLEGKKLC